MSSSQLIKQSTGFILKGILKLPKLNHAKKNLNVSINDNVDIFELSTTDFKPGNKNAKMSKDAD